MVYQLQVIIDFCEVNKIMFFKKNPKLTKTILYVFLLKKIFKIMSNFWLKNKKSNSKYMTFNV